MPRPDHSRISWWSGKLKDSKGPHQLQIGLRRLRSLFSVFTFVLESPEMGRLNEEAGWVGQKVGRLPDLGVLTYEIVRREAIPHPEEAGFATCADSLSPQAGKLHQTLAKLPAGAGIPY
jgi:triphosphatase